MTNPPTQPNDPPAPPTQTGRVTVIEADLCNPSHAEAITSLLNDYACDLMGCGESLPRDVLDGLIPGLRACPTSRVYLGCVGEHYAGLAICFLAFATFSAGPSLNIHDFAVAPRFRRQGVGDAMLRRIVADARERGAVKLTLEVRPDNAPAQRLYRRHGIEPGDPGYEFWSKML